ncbi:hypothetical protein Halha_0383 [Halobacteroides halobius DSM 5150]|uniref:Sporulation membrane protein YtrI C-terminal domain-containing protein n=1 Tax=Halobacteroides halobius (strain ATCC 35273 / DSM 5150 / MD-1) TaxID=748449 RepID=L0K8D5_HALHC|nr:hypothetical protein [Halobacteroides halobius]AGB40378.1 hypothetical protein Halha_0383 [Halobacteroides halobius DSM 5150]
MEFRFLALTKKEFARILASFILGIIIGGCLINLWIGRELDQLIYEKKQLVATINTQETELKKLKKSLKEEKRTIIQELEINVQTKGDKHLKQELKERTFKLLDSLIGRNIAKIDGQLIANTINERIIIIEEKNYQLKLVWLIIQPKAVVKVEFTEVDN